MPASKDGTIYDAGLVRRLSAEINATDDPARLDELLQLLRAVIRDDHEELRLRLAFLVKKYAYLFEDRKAHGA